MIQEEDEPALRSLIDVKVHYLAGNPVFFQHVFNHSQGFKLEFVFGENEFFTDKSLFKTYYLGSNPDSPFGDMIYERAEGSKISWKPEKDLSVKIEIKKQRHKGIVSSF